MDQQQTIQDILETVLFIKEKAASKEDLAAEVSSLRSEMVTLRSEMVTKQDLAMEVSSLRDEMATKEDLAEVENRLVTHIDGFVVMHQKLDIELLALRSKYDRLESFDQKVAQHLHLEISF